MSSAGAPIPFMRKYDGRFQLCIDYRGLNNLTIKLVSLSSIEEFLDRWGQAKTIPTTCFDKCLIKQRPEKGNKWKIAFRTWYGHFEYQVTMSFDLFNASARFLGQIGLYKKRK